MDVSTDESDFVMGPENAVDLIDKLIESFQDKKKQLQKGTLSNGDRALLCIDAADTCFTFGEAFAEQQKIHMAAGLEDLRKK